MTAAKSAPGQGPKLTVVEGAQTGSPGQRLMRARSQRNLAIEDVARQLNLSVSMVKALESDNYKSLPGRAFVKGYLRNYAKLVAIDASDLLRAYESQFGAGDDAQLNPPDLARPPRWIAPLVKGLGYLIVLLIVVGIGSLVYQNFGALADKALQITATFKNGDEASAPMDTAESTQPAADAGDTVRLSIPLHPVEVAPSPVQAGGVAADGTPTPTTAETPVAAPVEPSGAPAPAAVPPQSSAEPQLNTSVTAIVSETPAQDEQSSTAAKVPLSASPQQMNEKTNASSGESLPGNEVASLSLEFSGLSWARVRDADGKILFDGTRSAGGELQLQGRAPFSIRLGNAPVVKVTLNGKPRDFDFSSRSNVAQFTLENE